MNNLRGGGPKSRSPWDETLSSGTDEPRRDPWTEERRADELGITALNRGPGTDSRGQQSPEQQPMRQLLTDAPATAHERLVQHHGVEQARIRLLQVARMLSAGKRPKCPTGVSLDTRCLYECCLLGLREQVETQVLLDLEEIELEYYLKVQ